jgi:hypothetical protein
VKALKRTSSFDESLFCLSSSIALNVSLKAFKTLTLGEVIFFAISSKDKSAAKDNWEASKRIKKKYILTLIKKLLIKTCFGIK